MKKFIILILILSSSSIFGQSLSGLNQRIGLTDSLTNEKEIRIYKHYGESGEYKETFRMYQDSSKIWRAELISYTTRAPNPGSLSLQKQELKSNSDMDMVWLNIVKTNIQDLPNMSDIYWKLKEEPVIEEINGVKELVWEITDIFDGEGFEVQFRWGKRSNRIVYYNPESFLKMYENVDELIYFNQLLNVLWTEFGIWEKE